LSCSLQGWEKLTDAVIKWINDHLNGVVFLLWGSYAQKKGSSINKVSRHVFDDQKNHMKFYIVEKTPRLEDGTSFSTFCSQRLFWV